MDSVAPSSGTGINQTFSVVFSDAAGYPAIGISSMLINYGLDAVKGCYWMYSQQGNAIYLRNDAGTAWLTPIQPGSGTVSNSQCTINGAGTSVLKAGNSITVNTAITFQSGFRGSQGVFGLAQNTSGTLSSGWQQKGTWTLP